MKIVHIIPGSGGSFYCGNCLRDSKIVQELRLLGHEVIKVPMYLPLFGHDKDLENVPIFYGAISLYIKERWPILSKAPGWLYRLLDSKPALRLASGMAGSTRAEGLENMTMSMLHGENGRQAEELEKMSQWIKEHFKPDVIHLSNALLLGVTKRLKEKLKVPLICSLQDEHEWIESMHPRFMDKVWSLMADKASHADAFISVSDYFSEMMQEKLKLSDQKLHRLYLGISPDDYEFKTTSKKPRHIGFISRMSHGNGLDILIDAFIELSKDANFSDVKLVLTGGYTKDDTRFIKKQKKKLILSGLEKRVDFHEDFSEAGRKAFFDKVTLVSVPARFTEAFGFYMLEAMASGVPIVQPQVGAFAEIIEVSGGGIYYEPNLPEKLSSTFKKLLSDPSHLDQLGKSGRKSIYKHFHIKEQTLKMVEIYKGVVNDNERMSPPNPPSRGAEIPLNGK